MTKLHELLAAEGNLETQAIQVKADLTNTFEKKEHLFQEKRQVFTPNDEKAGNSVIELQSDIQTNVRKELDWVANHLIKAIDASYQVADTNTRARADIILEDGEIIAKEVPATALLELEKRLSEWVLSLVKSVKTLDPARGFQPDTARGKNIYQARPITKMRTKKDIKVIVKYEATKEHPAQTEMVSVDVPVGTIQEQEWSGLITPAEKSEMLDRAEQLIRAVRKARSRANEAEVNTAQKIGKTLLAFVFEGKK